MELVRNAIFTACITAMISAAVMMIAPDNRRRELRLICTLVLISCIMSGILGTDLEIHDVALPQSQSLEFDYERMLLTQSRMNMETQVTKKLTDIGLSARLVCIEVGLDQYNYIKPERAEVYISGLDDSEMPAAEAAVREVVGEESEVYIYVS
ncbi:MAG: hypothetical protein IJ723_06995 [Ruminococcus sp.]|nr:hypothetical protein [Ruminococcus sp.]